MTRISTPATAQVVAGRVSVKGVTLTEDYVLACAKGLIPGAALERKFGRNPDVDTSAETIWASGGIYTFPSGAEVVDTVSSDANDTSAGTGARTVEIFGLDANYHPINEIVSMNGATPVASSNSYLRVFRAIVRTAGSGGQNAGNITIDQTTSGDVVGYITAGLNQTQLGIYTVPANKTGYMLGVMAGATKNTGSNIDVDLFVRPEGEVFQLKGTYSASTDAAMSYLEFTSPIVLSAKSDLRFDATATSVNTQATVEFSILLVDN